MKRHLLLSVAVGVFTAISSYGQGMGGPPAPKFSGPMAKFFGEASNFSATLEMQTKDPQGNDMKMPGKLTFSDGKSRFEMNMAEMGGKMASVAAQMKAMGMDRMVVISRPDKQVTEMIYPGMNSYLETPLQDEQSSTNAEDYKIETTELGKETVDGHPCIKNKAVVTDKKGNKHEATIWNATDMRKFPVKIEQNEGGQHAIMLFKNVQFTKPADKEFEVPSEYTKYTSMPEMIQAIMTKKFGGQGGFAPPPVPKRP